MHVITPFLDYYPECYKSLLLELPVVCYTNLMNEVKDSVIEFIVKKCQESFDCPEVYLFGSRASKTNCDRSDYDIVVDTKGASSIAWARFLVEVDEQAPTLLKLDIIRLDSKLPAKLLKEITENAVVVN